MSELNKEHSFQRSAPVSWLFKMAWRDSRRNRSRLLLFTSSIILGIAALVAVYSFRDNLQRDIDEQAKSLTGADLIIDSRASFSPAATAMLDTIGQERSRQLDFASMLYFVKGGGNRLVQIKALEGDFPYYGTIETTPVQAAKAIKTGKNVLVDKTVMLQYNAKPGDSVRIGKSTFAIAGFLDNAPGQTGFSATISPVVYLPLAALAETGLVQFGSRIHYSYFYKFSNPAQVGTLIKQLQTSLDKEGLDYQTVESKKRDTGRSFQDLGRFLALSGFVALLLGCVGVGSAIHVYVNEKIAAISTLRCLGLSAWEAFFIYLIQITFIGLAGAIAGAVLGTAIQYLLPLVFKDFLPIAFTMQISWAAIVQGILTGLVISILFALPSLLSLRRVSPLNAIRLSFESVHASKEPLKWLVYAAILLFIIGFGYLQMQSWMQAFLFSAAILVAIAVFYGLSVLLLKLVRTLIPAGMSYPWRQGFSNLYRPNNQTLMLIIAIGLTTTLIATLYFVQGILIGKITLSTGNSQPNMVLFDIQSNQEKAVSALLKKYKLPEMNRVEVVTMRLEEINGRNAADLARQDSLTAKPLKDENERRESSSRAFKGELRATYQDTLTAAEVLSSGKWVGRIKSPGDIIYVSLDERYAERINVKLGDKITFNVQGMRIPTVVGSLRKIDWGRVQTNFRIVFPLGVLEEAPQFHVMMTRVPDNTISADFQGQVVQHYPNISVIDLRLVLQVLDDLLGKMSMVIIFMASFSMITGWIVLVSAVRSSKNQRLKEIVLLRTIGANSGQIIKITAIEYLFLGFFAAAAGMLIAIAGSWFLAVYNFDTVFQLPFLPALVIFASVIFIVVLTGMLSSLTVLRSSPLAILRKDN